MNEQEGKSEDKKNQSAIRAPFQERMVGVVELESTTSTMSTWRSNQLSYTPSFQIENSIYYTIDSRKVKKVFQKMRKKASSTSSGKTAE